MPVRIIIDTNTYLSAIFKDGICREATNLLIDNKSEIFATKEILLEYEISEKKYKAKTNNAILDNTIKSKIINSIQIIKSKTIVNICRDPNDNMFLSCAVDAQASLLVSGDKDLYEKKVLEFAKNNKIRILNAHDVLLQYSNKYTILI